MRRGPDRTLHLSAVSENAVREVLSYYGYDDSRNHSEFTAALLRAWDIADFRNRAALAEAFPHIARAVLLLETYGGAELSRLIRKGQRR